MLSPTPQRSWLAALAVYFRAPVITMLFLGFSAGLPFLLVFSTLSAWLRSDGVEVAAIGFFAWIGMLYSIKFFWAPVVDRLALPILTRAFGQRRGWMLLAQGLIVAGLVGLAGLSPVGNLGWVALFALLVAFGSATQDIAIDAYRIESADDNVQAAMASTYIIGYRGGLLAAGAGALYIAASASWDVAYMSMAALMSIGVLTVLLRPEPKRASLSIQLIHEPKVRAFIRASRGKPKLLRRLGAWSIGALVCPFTDFFSRYGVKALWILVFIAVFRISDLAMASMANPLYIDLGFSLAEIANVTNIFGIAMSITGGMLGGLFVARYGIGPLLIFGAGLVMVTNLLFAVLAVVGNQLPMLVVTIIGDNLANGLASAVFIAFLSSLTSRAYTATQYALFSSLMTLPGKFLSGFGGLVVTAQGYPSFFVIATLLGIPAIVLAIWISRDKQLVPTPKPA
ncbi:MFS transporter [Halomonas sp. FeN2]|jgi:MFS transporter, PAT family, beta-lactamase induction signal transducer AmpG|uniref:MFS transporter n=1 Tax=Vreelandella neptunia TaxID=115551 RepID=A0ABZ0YQS8_9GAMM|nr:MULTISPECIES: MFS transporter [Halomonas]TDV99468.1 PAT family beta-lactamase induction signal transducer AmpG [Halomonas alkaliantarctica]MBF57837.1 AmpG family muropeptide MFS transporter [Halomonas sp.]MDN3561617.1 MFS transporter [Halomonas neptunia]UBR49737.1 MFS transporter [Halomonas sp. FeN2]WQH14520.1 MFS transporter [Halomonas neptunia]|tara:strand:- start:190 stop:1551 length:1362 start_codon:yes stop_codon:yes gene_type:complete